MRYHYDGESSQLIAPTICSDVYRCRSLNIVNWGRIYFFILFCVIQFLCFSIFSRFFVRLLQLNFILYELLFFVKNFKFFSLFEDEYNKIFRLENCMRRKINCKDLIFFVNIFSDYCELISKSTWMLNKINISYYKWQLFVGGIGAVLLLYYFCLWFDTI